jgi:NADH dehydrogenase
LTFCQHFRDLNARDDVDRTNHIFSTAAYQVAAAGLSAPEIAQPIRSILSCRPNITALLDQVTGFRSRRQNGHSATEPAAIRLSRSALGSCTSYFGHPEWEHCAWPENADDALRIRSQVLLAFEKAENAERGGRERS